MVQEVEIVEVDIDGRTFWVRPVGSSVLQSNNVVAEGLAISLDKPLEWAVGFFFGNVELILITLVALVAGMMVGSSSASVDEPSTPAFSDAEAIEAVKKHLRSIGMDTYCREIAEEAERWKVNQDKSNPDKYLVTAEEWGDKLTWTFVGSRLSIIPTSNAETQAGEKGC